MSLKDTYRFVLYGDSISKGVIYDEQKKKYIVLDENFPALLQNKLKGIIYNVAKFGNTLIRAIGKLPNEVLKKNPDVVIIEFGGNDCDFDWEQIAENPDGIHNPKTDFNVFQRLLRNLIDTLNRNGIIPVLLTLPPIDADKYFKWISKNSAAVGEKILKWLGSVTKIYWWQERYNSAIVSIANETKTRLIDIRSSFLKHPDYREFLCLDGIHPNRQGHRIIADRIYEYIKTHCSFLLKDDYSPENV